MILTLPRLAFAGGLLALAVLPAALGLQDATPAPKAEKPAERAAPEVAKVGVAAPDFTLKNLKGEDVKLSSFTADKKIVVLEWFNPDCPITRAYHEPESVMSPLAASYAGKDVVWLAINSGAPGKQGAGLERNVKAAEDFAITYPLLLDESGAVGKLYGARTTPHMYVIDAAGVLRYAGAIDNGSPQTKGETNYVKEALEAILAGRDVATTESRAFGCSVKYAD